MSLDSGDAGGWPFSLDTLSVSLYKNQPENISLAGDIVIPISDEDNELHYYGFIDNSGEYFLNVHLRDTMDVPVWAAKLSVYDNSFININKKDNAFAASAVLNGELSIAKDGDGSVQIAGMEFQQLAIQNHRPYIDIHTVALAGSEQNKMANFPITIKEVIFTKKEMSVGLGFNLAVNFVGDKDKGFAGDAGFSLWGDLAEQDGRMKWQYREMLFDEINIDMDAGAYSLQGALMIYRADPTFGKGFKGMINASFQPGLIVSASAQFGSVNDMRYWYVDGLLAMPTGIPIFPGFAVYGFGGGAYYHMSRQNTGNVNIPAGSSANPTDNSDLPGQSLSGIVYLPDPNSHLGVKASVIAGTYPKPDAFNATVGFEMNFNSGGGLNFIGFKGDAYFMTPIADRGSDSKVFATTDIGYDFTNKVLHGTTSVYVNMPHLVVGANPGNLAGTSVIHFEPNDWYITVGTPAQRVGIKVIDIFTLSSYFMIGTNIPAMPLPPGNVTEILGDIEFNRDLDALTSGGGFALGADLQIDFDGEFWKFYASFGAGAGFDMMLKNYGTDTHCSGSSEPIGIKGWYAQGQMYAYIQGAVGIRIDKGLFKGDYKVLDVGAASVLQAKLPNPFWMQGNIGGYYSILNGMIEGKCNFEFELGEQCEIEAGSGLSGMNVIAETTPAPNSQDVNVFNGAQAAFNMKVDQIFQFVDIDDVTHSYKIVLDHFKLMHQGQEIPGKLVWNDKNDVVAVETFDILPGESEIDLKVQIHFEEKLNGIWQPVMTNGKIENESVETSFTTGPAPDYIPPNNVLYTYPIENQMHYHQDEVDYGFIKLKKGQDYLFIANDSITQKVRFKSTSHQTDFDFTYNDNTNTVQFTTDTNLKTDEIYAFMLVNIPVNENAEIDENVADFTENITNEANNNSVDIQKKDIEGSLTLMQEKEIYSSYFKTSKYNTFIQKINAMNLTAPWSWVIYNGVHKIGVKFKGNEHLDKFEMLGTDDFYPLIQIFNVNNNNWFNNYAYPLIYCPLTGNACGSKYPSEIGINWADRPEYVDIPPSRTSFLTSYPSGYPQLTQSDIENDQAQTDAVLTNLTNVMEYYHYKDYESLLQQASKHELKDSNPALIKILNTPYPSLLLGYPNYNYYKVELKYFIPGTNTPTSSKTISIGY